MVIWFAFETIFKSLQAVIDESGMVNYIELVDKLMNMW